jgi:hypothetical protein
MSIVIHIVGEQTNQFYTILWLVYKITEVRDRMFELNENY